MRFRQSIVEYINRTISRRIIGQVSIDLFLVLASACLAVVLRFGLHDTRTVHSLNVTRHYAVYLALLRLFWLYIFRVYRVYWRYISLYDLKNIVWATTASSLSFAAVLALLGRHDVPHSVQVMDWAANIFFIGGARLAFRWADWNLLGAKWGKPFLDRSVRRMKTLIVGAGDAGEMVARDLLRQADNSYSPIGFVDDDTRKRYLRIHGLPVLGKFADIPSLVAQHEVESILIALPHALGHEIRDIVTLCEQTDAQLRILPGVTEALDNAPFPQRIRQVEIEDLLRRPPVRVNLDEIASYISRQKVLITGAGGSIGSELCRQIASLNPQQLILLGQGENSVFEIQQELLRETGAQPVALVGSVQDRRFLDELFERHRPNVVFHAAAHKHVPLMEENPCEAVKNNVLGTKNVAELAVHYGASKFIYVSTDKAVNPLSVMGASKRLGEMVVQAMGEAGRTQFTTVRFGNVLGSRGSVIPTMKRQIARGGPVTVTHRDMTRYFMTIPEAVQLIIQAGAMGKRGEIFILDMGDPVKIVNLARDLIKLSGFVPEQDIKIVFTGIRPGEKIFEELLTTDERKHATTHEKIFVAPSQGASAQRLMPRVDTLITYAQAGESEQVRASLFALVRCAPQELAGAVPSENGRNGHAPRANGSVSPNGQGQGLQGNGNGHGGRGNGHAARPREDKSSRDKIEPTAREKTEPRAENGTWGIETTAAA